MKVRVSALRLAVVVRAGALPMGCGVRCCGGYLDRLGWVLRSPLSCSLGSSPLTNLNVVVRGPRSVELHWFHGACPWFGAVFRMRLCSIVETVPRAALRLGLVVLREL